MLYQIQSDARQIPLRDQSVQCVVTSPPYWGLRDYGTAVWIGGDAACSHKPKVKSRASRPKGLLNGSIETVDQSSVQRDCHCGAARVDQQIGLEKSPSAYVATMVAVFREVWRVLRDDGTVWLNIGDSYASGKGTCHNPGGNTSSFNVHLKAQNVHPLDRGNKSTLAAVGLKPKDLVGIPWRVAFALQADGWYLRSDIIWAKPNPMPESVTDRPTRSHEYLFLLSKSARYYYNAEAIAEPASFAGKVVTLGEKSLSRGQANGANVTPSGNGRANSVTVRDRRNARSVWWIATQATGVAHFATFPEALVRPCILAGSRPGDLVLDPFAGTGTVGKVALEHGRRAVMLDLNYDYLRLDPRKRQPQIGMGI